LPPPGPPPETPGDNPYVAQAFVRAFEQLHAVAGVRRALAQEIPS
jgi:hypothetical protein